MVESSSEAPTTVSFLTASAISSVQPHSPALGESRKNYMARKSPTSRSSSPSWEMNVQPGTYSRSFPEYSPGNYQIEIGGIQEGFHCPSLTQYERELPYVLSEASASKPNPEASGNLAIRSSSTTTQISASSSNSSASPSTKLRYRKPPSIEHFRRALKEKLKDSEHFPGVDLDAFNPPLRSLIKMLKTKFSQTDNDSAIAAYRDLLLIYPDQEELQRMFDEACYCKGDVETAIVEWYELSVQYPRTFGFQKYLRLAYEKRGDMDQAINGWKTLLYMEPDDYYLQKNLKAAYEKKADVDEAIHGWTELLTFHPKAGGLHKKLQEEYDKCSDPHRAMAGWLGLAERHPGNELIQKWLKRAVEAHIATNWPSSFNDFPGTEMKSRLSITTSLNWSEFSLFRRTLDEADEVYHVLDDVPGAGIEIGVDILSTNISLANSSLGRSFTGKYTQRTLVTSLN
jgi:tetratricopeptide (TPR) repeat protein